MALILDYRTTAAELPLSSRARQIIVPLLILVGVQCWLILGRGDYGRSFQRYLLLGAVAVALLGLIPAIGRAAMSCLDIFRYPSRRARLIAAVCITIIASSYLIFTGWYQGRNFQPKWQDEMSYIIQFRMLAEGKLWMPGHELADFFDSFQLIVDPVYASMYFPGAALLYAPAQFLGLPFWFMSVLMSGISVGLLYLIMTELIDGVAGILAVLMILGMFMFRKLSLMIGGHPPTLMLELAFVYSFLRWREHCEGLGRGSRGWAIAMGLFVGWCAITRPLDALVVALPVGSMMILDLIGQPVRRWVITAVCLVAGALPFLALQIVFNIGVTGTWHRTPFEHYADRDYPGTKLGFHQFDPTLRPVSNLPQKQKFHDEWTIPAIQAHQPARILRNWLGQSVEEPGRLQGMLQDGMPNRMMMALLPAGLLGFVTRKRLAVWLALPCFIILFSFYTFFLQHYMIIVAPVIILWVLLGAHVIENTWASARPMLAIFLTLAIAILSLTEMPQINRLTEPDEIFIPAGYSTIDQTLAALPRKPAVVLFRFDTEKNNPHEEPVYNIDTAWPDEATVIRAHDLGGRNSEIFRYYAQRHPERAFYLYDRGDDSIRYLGTARELIGLND